MQLGRAHVEARQLGVLAGEHGAQRFGDDFVPEKAAKADAIEDGAHR